MRNYLKLTSEEKRKRAVARFWSRVMKGNETECWKWTASAYGDGYGHFRLKGCPSGAHRFSYYLKNGDFDRRLFVLHKCDNPRCVNPAHLFLGTSQDNIRDCVAKGRNRPPTGESSATAILNGTAVLEMRRLYRERKASSIGIAKKFGIARQLAIKAIRGETWAHLPGAVSRSERSKYDRKGNS